MADLHAIISEAGAKGISLAKLKTVSKLNDDLLQSELKRLRSELLIAGPFPFRKGSVFYSKGYEPGGESVARQIESLIQDTGLKLPTTKQIQGKIKKPFTEFFKDGVRTLVGKGRAAELKGGNSVYLLHVDAARRLFPEASTFPSAIDSESPAVSFKKDVVNAYHALKSEQGGLSSVSIGKLLSRLGCSKQTLHRFLLEEARHGEVDLHPTTLVDLDPEDREGALPIPGKNESAISVTFRG